MGVTWVVCGPGHPSSHFQSKESKNRGCSQKLERAEMYASEDCDEAQSRKGA